MDIGAIGSSSIDMNLAQVQQSVQVTTLKNAMDQQKASAETLLTEMLPQSFGHSFDVRV